MRSVIFLACYKLVQNEVVLLRVNYNSNVKIRFRSVAGTLKLR